MFSTNLIDSPSTGGMEKGLRAIAEAEDQNLVGWLRDFGRAACGGQPVTIQSIDCAALPGSLGSLVAARDRLMEIPRWSRSEV